MTQLERLIYDAITERQQMNEETGKSPTYVTMPEVINALAVEIREALNRLVTENLLEWHQTVNGVRMFGIKDDNR